MWELDHKEGWVPKNWCFQIVSWRRLLRVSWKAMRWNHPILKKINPEYSLEGLMLKLKLQILWSPNANWWLTGKDLDARKDWGQEEKGATEDDIVGWHHWLNGHEFEQTQGDREGQGGLVCCSPWACKELDTNERLNNSRCYSWCYEHQCSLWCWEYNFERENKDSDSILFCPVRNMVVGGNTYQGVTVVM